MVKDFNRRFMSFYWILCFYFKQRPMLIKLVGWVLRFYGGFWDTLAIFPNRKLSRTFYKNHTHFGIFHRNLHLHYSLEAYEWSRGLLSSFFWYFPTFQSKILIKWRSSVESDLRGHIKEIWVFRNQEFQKGLICVIFNLL